LDLNWRIVRDRKHSASRRRKGLKKEREGPISEKRIAELKRYHWEKKAFTTRLWHHDRLTHTERGREDLGQKEGKAG